MKTTSSVVTAALLTTSTALKVAQYDIYGSSSSERLSKALAQRDTVLEPLANLVPTAGAYFINVSIGTPPQNVALQIDTGSSELWVLEQGVPYCKNTTCVGGYFSPEKSSSYQLVQANGLNETYGAGRHAYGDSATEVISIGNATVQKQRFSVVNDTDENLGIMGIGFELNQGACGSNLKNCPTYPSFVDNLVQNDIILTEAYSLWLNDLNTSAGSILFGGVDSSRYTGDLVALPIVKLQNEYIEFRVSWTNLEINTPNGTDQVWAQRAVYQTLLDSGTTQSNFPVEVADALYELVGAELADLPGDPLYITDCNVLKSNVSLDFTFGGNNGVTITVPLRELITQVPAEATTQQFANGDAICICGWTAAQNYNVILGDTFLRSAYVVFDLSNAQIALAQANYNPGQPKVQEIGKTIPGVARTMSALSAAPFSTVPSSVLTVPTTNIPAPTSYPLAQFITGTYTPTSATAAASGSGAGAGGAIGGSLSGTPSVSASGSATSAHGSNAGTAVTPSMQNTMMVVFASILAISGAGMLLL